MEQLELPFREFERKSSTYDPKDMAYDPASHLLLPVTTKKGEVLLTAEERHRLMHEIARKAAQHSRNIWNN